MEALHGSRGGLSDAEPVDRLELTTCCLQNRIRGMLVMPYSATGREMSQHLPTVSCSSIRSMSVAANVTRRKTSRFEESVVMLSLVTRRFVLLPLLILEQSCSRLSPASRWSRTRRQKQKTATNSRVAEIGRPGRNHGLVGRVGIPPLNPYTDRVLALLQHNKSLSPLTLSLTST